MIQPKSKNFTLYVHTADLPKECGVMRFLNRLIEEIKKNGYNVTTNFNEKNITHMLNTGIKSKNIIDDCKKRNIKIISRFSEVNKVFYDQLEQSYLNSDKIIYQSQISKISYRAEFGERNIPEKIIKNGIDFNEFGKIDKKKKKNIISIGAFHEREKCSNVKKIKTLEYFLNAIIPIFENDDEWKYYVVGPGDHHEKLKKYLDMPCFRGRVFFVGRNEDNKPKFLKNEEIFNIAKNCSIYAHTTLNDCCPNALLESMSMGLPVLYFNYGGLSEMFNNHINKESVPMELDEEDIKRAILHSYDNFEHYSFKSLELARTKYNISNIANQYIEYILGDNN